MFMREYLQSQKKGCILPCGKKHPFMVAVPDSVNRSHPLV